MLTRSQIRAAARLQNQLANPPRRIVRNKECKWSRATPEDKGSDCWETSCGNSFVLNDGTPGDNNMRFCCYCGGALPSEGNG